MNGNGRDWQEKNLCRRYFICAVGCSCCVVFSRIDEMTWLLNGYEISLRLSNLSFETQFCLSKLCKGAFPLDAKRRLATFASCRLRHLLKIS